MPGFADALAQLAGYLNTRTPDRRPTFLEGAVPGGRSPVGSMVPSAAGAPGAMGKAAMGTGAGGAGGGTGIQPNIFGDLTGGPGGDGGPSGPGPGKTKHLTHQIVIQHAKRMHARDGRRGRNQIRFGNGNQLRAHRVV